MFTRNFPPYTFILGRVFFNLFVRVVFFADSPSSVQSQSCSDVIRHRIQHARYWFWFLYSLWICASNGHHNKQVGTSTTFWLLWSTRCKWNSFPRMRLFRPTYGNPHSGIRVIFFLTWNSGIECFGIKNSAHGIRNLNSTDKESWIHSVESKIQSWRVQKVHHKLQWD